MPWRKRCTTTRRPGCSSSWRPRPRLEAVRYAEDVDRLVELSARSRRQLGADGVERFLSLDVAGTLRIGQHAAERRVHEADRLASVLPLTLAGLRSARLRVPQARVLLAETARCSEPVGCGR